MHLSRIVIVAGIIVVTVLVVFVLIVTNSLYLVCFFHKKYDIWREQSENRVTEGDLYYHGPHLVYMNDRESWYINRNDKKQEDDNGGLNNKEKIARNSHHRQRV